MWYVYIIKSLSHNWYYVGLTKDVDRRFLRHNAGKEKATKFYRPFILIFVQITESRGQTRDLEKLLKVHYNKEALLELFAGMAKLVDLPAQAGA